MFLFNKCFFITFSTAYRILLMEIRTLRVILQTLYKLLKSFIDSDRAEILIFFVRKVPILITLKSLYYRIIDQFSNLLVS